jgi:hypothetical protein
MRSDFILPALLAVALAVMVGYAATGNRHDGQAFQVSPAVCEAGSIGTVGELREASGLALSRRTPQLFWSHNDSAEPVVYGVDVNARIRARIRVAGASVMDWEAVTTAPCASGDCLFIGDIGDNKRVRRGITIYRVDEPSPEQQASANVHTLEGMYPEGPQDAEAMFVAQGALYIVTKGDSVPVRLYRLPALDADGQMQKLELVAPLTKGPATDATRITDAGISPDGRWVALRSKEQVLFYETRPLISGTPATPSSFDVRRLQEPQGEGITWVDDRTLLLAGEGPRGGTLARVTCTALN